MLADHHERLVELLLDFLRFHPERAEPYAFAPEADEAIVLVLDALFSLEEDPHPMIDELLRLSCALELEMRSPAAAALIRAALHDDARVRALELHGGETEAEAHERLSCFSGEKDEKRAPMFGEESPEGALKPASFAAVVPAHIARGELRKRLLAK